MAKLLVLINGNGTNDFGTLDIRGDVTLDGIIGGTNSIHLFNIGAADDGNYTVTAHDSINATSVTINGASTKLSLDDNKSINGNVTIGNSAGLSLGNGSTVNGTITGDSQYNGMLTIQAGATVAAGGNIGAGDLDLNQIKIQGTFDLSGLSAYEAHAQTFNLTSGASLIIGAGVIEGAIKGLGSGDGGVSNGVGIGSVNFSANIDTTNLLVSTLGTTDGHALANVSVAENLTVDTGNINISATRITLNTGASLTSSASEINGGNQVAAGLTRLNTQVKLNSDASLTLDNVTRFMGTIDGNAAGQGDLTLNGTYIYNDGDDEINIGSNSKLASITLTDSSTLDVSLFNGYVKANAITLSNNAVLTVGSGTIVGTVDSDANENAIFNILGTTTLSGAIGATHKLAELNIGNSTHFLGATANNSITADSVTLNTTGNPGEITSLTLADDHSITGNVSLSSNTRLYLGNNSYVDGTIEGHGELHIQEGAAVTARGNIGAGDGNSLSGVAINDGSKLTLDNYSLTADSISLIDDSELEIGSATVNADILGYYLGGAAYGNGEGTVTFNGATNTMGGDIGNATGNAVNLVTVKSGGKSVNTNSHSIYSSNIIIAANSSLTATNGTIAGSADASEDHVLGRANLTLNSGATFTIGFGATAFANINGSANNTGNLVIAPDAYVNNNLLVGQNFTLSNVTIKNGATLDIAGNNVPLSATTISLEENAVFSIGTSTVNGIIDGTVASKGTVNVERSSTYGAGITFGSTNGLLAVNFGNNEGATISVANSIKALTTKIIGSGTSLSLGAGSSITGNVVLDGDSILSLGNSSTVNGTIRNLSDSTYNGTLMIRENATVATNGNIGGGGFNFSTVMLRDNSNLNLSTHNNSINSLLVQIGYGATLTIGTASVNAEIQAYNTGDGPNYGLGNVIFTANNTVGGNVGSESGATLESITLNTGVEVDAGSNGFNAIDIILSDGAILESAGQISAGSATEGAPLSNAAITLGDDAILKLSSGADLTATVDGDEDNHGQLEILSGTIVAGGNIGATSSLESVSISSGATLNLHTNNVSLNATSISLDNTATLTIGTASVENNILSTANDNGNVSFNGANNSLHANVGGHNDNALHNVTINNSNSVAAGSHEINASTITLGTYSTLTTSGAISGGADITGSTPIATAVTLNTNAILVFNTGSSLFGTVDGAHDEEGTIEFAANFTTNGNIGATHKLASVIVNDGVNLDLATNANSLNATTLYLGDATLTIGGGSLNAAIASLTADSGVMYINDSTTLDSGSTLGGDAGLLSLYIDHDAVGDVTVDSNDSIRARNVNIEGFRTKLNLAADKTIIGNVNLGDGSRLILGNGSSVTGTIDSMNDSGGALRISGDVTSQSNIGNGHILGSVTLDSSVTLDLSTHDNILKSESVTLGASSILRVGSGAIVGSFIGGTNSTIDFTKDNNIAEGTLLGHAGSDNNIYNLNIASGATVHQNEDVFSKYTTVYGDLIVAQNKGITGDDVFLNGGTLTLKNNSHINANVKGLSGTGSVVIDDNASFTTSHYLGGDDVYTLGSVVLKGGSTLDLASNNNTINAENIILNNGATLDIGSATVVGTIKGNTDGKGSVNFYSNNDLGGSLGINGNALSAVTVNAGVIGNTINTQGNSIYANNITLQDNAKLISSSAISADAITMYINSNLTLNDGASVAASINAASDNSSGLGVVDVASGTVTLNGNIGNLHKINTLTIANGATLNNSANAGIINAASINVGTGSTLSMSNISGSGSGDYGLNGNVNGTGTVNLSVAGGTYDLNATLGASSTLATVNITSSSTLNIKNSIQANTVNFNNSGTSSYLTLAATKNISGDIVLGSGTFFNLKNNSSVTGEIKAASNNVGTLIIGTNLSGSGGASASVVANDKIGTNSNKLAAIILNDNATLDLTTHAIDAYAYSSSIGTNSTLNIGDGSFTLVNNLTISENSNVTIDAGSLTAANISIGNSSSISVGAGSLNANVSIGTNATLSFDNNADVNLFEINGSANNVGTLTLSGNFSFNTTENIGSTHALATINVGANTRLNAYSGGNSIKVRDMNLSSGASVLLTEGSTISGNINGENNGDGEIFAYGNVSFNTIGSTHSIDSITVDSGSTTTFNGNISALNDININGQAIFSAASTTITANSFNLNSGSSLSLSINLTSPAAAALEVIGAAILSANTTLNLTISGSAVSGTVITLLNASEASTLEEITADKINLNNNGTNILNGQTYTTSISGNQFLLTLTGDAIVNSLTFSNSNYQGIYDAIMNVSDATGELATIKNYLENNSYSIEQKEAAIKSALPEVDNSSNRIAFNNASTSAGIFSARIESLNNNSVTTAGPTFNFSMNSNGRPATAETLEPLRDNNIKPSYPLSLALNQDGSKENKAMWIQTFGSNIKQDNNSKSEGYNSNSGGVLIGFDCEKCQDFIVGTAIGYTQSRINSQDKSKNTNIESYQISAYTGYNAKSFFFSNSATFALNNYSSNRAIQISNSTAKANYSGQTYTLRSEIGKNYKFESGLIFTPSLMLTGSYNTTDSYSENGAGSLNLHNESNSAKFFETRIGVELSKLYLTQKNTKIRPQFSASYGYDLIGDQQKSTSNFVGQSTTFASEGAKVAQGSFKVGAGFAFYTTNDVTLSLNYGFESRTGYTSNSGWLRVRYGF